jgi:hypothetical protein
MPPRKRAPSKKVVLDAQADKEADANRIQASQRRKRVNSSAGDASKKSTSKKQKQGVPRATTRVASDVDSAVSTHRHVNSDDDEASATTLGDDNKEGVEGTIRKDPLRFTMTWKAMAGKVEMPGVRFASSKPNDITYDILMQWGIEVEIRYLVKYTDHRLSFNTLEVVVTYDKARTPQELKMEINGNDNLRPVFEILRTFFSEGKKPTARFTSQYSIDDSRLQSQSITPAPTPSSQRRPRSTATTGQLSALPEIVDSETAAGNLMPTIIAEWPYKNIHCRNKGATCWVINRARDNPADHYIVDGELLRRWNRLIKDLKSTAKELSPDIIIDLVNHRRRRDEHKRRLLTATTTTTTALALSTTSDSPTMAKLVEAITIQNMLSLQARLPPSPLPTAAHSIAGTAPGTAPGPSSYQALVPPPIAPSSPINRPYDEVLEGFFQWFISLYAGRGEEPLLQATCDRLMEEGVDLNAIRIA